MKRMKAFLLIGIVALAGCAGTGSKRQSTPTNSVNVLVAPFEYRGPAEHSWIAAGVSDIVVSGFSRVRAVNVFSDSDRAQAMKEMAFGMTGAVRERDIVTVGGILGARVIFAGSVQVNGSNVRIVARIIDAESARVERAITLDGRRESLFELQDRVVIGLLDATNQVPSFAQVSPLVRAEETKAVVIRPTTKPDAYAWYAKGLRVHFTRPAEAVGYYAKACSIDADFFQAYTKMGQAYTETNAFADALRCHERARGILEGGALRESVDYAESLSGTGSVYWGMGESDAARLHHEKALALLAKIGRRDSGMYADILGRVGAAYIQKNELAEGIRTSERALDMLQAAGLGNSSSAINTLINIGAAYVKKGDKAAAMKRFTRSEEIRERIGFVNTRSHAIAMSNIGSVHFLMGDRDKALASFLRAEEIWEKTGLTNTYDHAMTLSNIGAVYLAKGDRKTGTAYLQRAAVINAKTGRGDLNRAIDAKLKSMNLRRVR